MARQANNQIVQRPQGQAAVSDFDDRGKKFTTFVNSNAIKNLLSQSLGGPQAAAQVTATLISQVSANPKLQQCQPMTILAAALRGEIGMGLSLVMGDYAIIPYGDQAQFQLQVNGLKRLCMNSNAYKKINCFDVREGEFLGRDPVTREPVFQWKDDEEREQLPIIGYYAFYILNDAYNGFTSTIYWPYEKILNHASRYSKAFDRDKYKNLLEGKITGWEAEKLRRGSPWYDEPTGEAHMKMCKKTVFKQLLGDGLAPKSAALAQAIASDDAMEATGEATYYGDEFDRMAKEAALAVAREAPEAKPVLEAAPAEAPAPTPAPAEPAPAQAPAQNEVRRGRKPKETTVPSVSNANAPAQQPKSGTVSMSDFPEMSDEDPFGDPIDDDPFL